MKILESEGARKFSLHHLSLLEAPVQVIVNAANSQLMHGGGIAGVISRRGGPEIQEESLLKAPVPTGSARPTTAGSLPFIGIIHAVGPIWRGGTQGERDLLYQAVQSALWEGEKLGVKSLALPAISTGIFGYPLEPAVTCIFLSIQDFLTHRAKSLETIMLCEVDQEKAYVMRTTIAPLLSGKQG